MGETERQRPEGSCRRQRCFWRRLRSKNRTVVSLGSLPTDKMSGREETNPESPPPRDGREVITDETRSDGHGGCGTTRAAATRTRQKTRNTKRMHPKKPRSMMTDHHSDLHELVQDCRQHQAPETMSSWAFFKEGVFHFGPG